MKITINNRIFNNKNQELMKQNLQRIRQKKKNLIKHKENRIFFKNKPKNLQRNKNFLLFTIFLLQNQHLKIQLKRSVAHNLKVFSQILIIVRLYQYKTKKKDKITFWIMLKEV